MSDFYVILHSADTSDANNKQSDFTVKLARPIQGAYEVAMSEISLKRRWDNVTKKNNFFYIGYHPNIDKHSVNSVEKTVMSADRKTLITGQTIVSMHKVEIEEGQYDQMSDLCEHIMENLNKVIIPGEVVISHVSEVNRVVIQMKKGYVISFSDSSLGQCLGFDETFLYPKDYEDVYGDYFFENDENTEITNAIAPYQPFILDDAHLIHVTLPGLTFPIICGERRESVVATIPGGDARDETLGVKCINRRYFPCISHFIPSIRVQLVDQHFRRVLVSSGEVVVILHFRPIQSTR
jgi:hypothetical protein